MSDSDTDSPPPEGGDVPPPHPEGYVNEFIRPLYDGLTYNEGGTSTWTLAIDPATVNLEESTFVVSASQVGTWEGGIPPEATDNGDGTYTIQSWPVEGMTVNGDGTVTLQVDIGPYAGPPAPPPSTP